MPTKQRFRLVPAVYLVLRREGRVLLLLRENSGYQDGMYSLVAGHLDGDELATQGMIREAKEEAGIDIDTQHLKLVHTAHRLTRNVPGQERIDLFFEAWEWQGEVHNREPDKCGGLDWVSLDALPANTVPFIRRVLSDIGKGVGYSEYEEEPVD